jgi:excinuclease UvrABC helicase subunit UvrB
MQQRAVPREVLDCLFEHGRACHDHHGAEILFFDKSSRARARRAGATEAIREMQRYFNTYAVVGSDGSLVTVGRRYRRYRRDA